MVMYNTAAVSAVCVWSTPAIACAWHHSRRKFCVGCSPANKPAQQCYPYTHIIRHYVRVRRTHRNEHTRWASSLFVPSIHERLSERTSTCKNASGFHRCSIERAPVSCTHPRGKIKSIPVVLLTHLRYVNSILRRTHTQEGTLSAWTTLGRCLGNAERRTDQRSLHKQRYDAS